jgi:hypothetical protein
MKQTQKKIDPSFDFDAIQEDHKIDKNYLAQLASTWKVHYMPRTAFQIELVKLNLDPIPNMAPDIAMIKFNKLAKAYESTARVTDFLDKMAREKEVIISISSMEVEGQEIIPSGGSLVELSATQHLAREVANIVSIYTSQKSEYISELIEAKVANEIKMPALDLVTIRAVIKVPGSDNSETRDAIYDKLRTKGKKNKCALLYMMTKIFSTPLLKPYSKVDQAMTQWYSTANTRKSMALKEIRVPQFDSFKSLVITKSVPAWRFYCKSLGARGGKKGRGELSYGYYRFDLPSATVELLNEMTDLYSICMHYNFKAVSLEYPNINLARLLIYNGITVYSPAMSSVVQPKKELVGVYSRGKLKTFLWMAANQTSPTLAKSTVTMPDPISIVTNEIAFVYEFIPTQLDPAYSYLPSIFAAEGLCIKFKMPKTKTVKAVITDIDVLYARFSTAVYFRNWFPFTRLTYVSQDPCRDFFSHKWKYPKITTDKTEDLFAGAAVKEYKVRETILYSQIDECEADVIADNDQELLDALEVYCDSQSDEKLNKLYKQREGEFIAPSDIAHVYLQMDREVFFQFIKAHLGDDLTLSNHSDTSDDDEAPKPQEDGDDKGNDDDEDDFDDVFKDSVVKTVYKKNLTKEQKAQIEKENDDDNDQDDNDENENGDDEDPSKVD